MENWISLAVVVHREQEKANKKDATVPATILHMVGSSRRHVFNGLAILPQCHSYQTSARADEWKKKLRRLYGGLWFMGRSVLLVYMLSCCWIKDMQANYIFPWLSANVRVFSIFIFFKNIFYRNIFLVSQFTVLYPYRPSAGRPAPCRPPPGGRDLYVIKIWVLSHGGPYHPVEGASMR